MTSLAPQPARSVADLTSGVILASVEIAAPPERVFPALTDPNALKRWVAGEVIPPPGSG